MFNNNFYKTKCEYSPLINKNYSLTYGQKIKTFQLFKYLNPKATSHFLNATTDKESWLILIIINPYSFKHSN